MKISLPWKKFLLVSGALALVFAITWAVVLWRWDVNFRAVSAGDVYLYLVALPLAIFFLGALMLYAGLRIRRAMATKDESSDAERATATQDTGEDSHPDTANGAVMVIAHAVVSKLGDAAAIMQAARQSQTAVGLDDSLLDSEGYRIYGARIEDLDATQLPPHIELPGAALGPVRLARMRALLTQLLGELTGKLDLAAALEPLPAATAAPGNAGMTPRTTIVDTRPAAEPQTLRVALYTPRLSGAEEAQMLEALFEEAWRRSGWAAQRHSLTVEEDDGTRAWREADRLIAAADGAPLTLLLAVDSWFDETLLGELDAAQRLRTARRASGLTPGEGAAALVLASAGWREQRGLPALAQLRRGHFMARGRPASAKGPTNSTALDECAARAMERAKTEEKNYVAVVCDSDLPGGRSTETALTMHHVLPGLDTSADRLEVPAALGHPGAACGLMMLAVATACVEAEQNGVLCLTAAHETERGAMALLPQDAAAEQG